MSGKGINPGQKVIALNVGSNVPNGYANEGWGYNQSWNSNWFHTPFHTQGSGYYPYNMPFPTNQSFNWGNSTGTSSTTSSPTSSSSTGTSGGMTSNTGGSDYNTGTSYNTGSNYNTGTSYNTGSNYNTGGGYNTGSTYSTGNFGPAYFGNYPPAGFATYGGNQFGHAGSFGSYNNGSQYVGNRGLRGHNVTPIAILSSVGINPDAPINVQQFFTTLFNQFGINTAGTFTGSFFNDYLNVLPTEHIPPKAILGLIGINPFVAINPSNFFERILSHFGSPQVVFNPVTFTSQFENLFGHSSYSSSYFTGNHPGHYNNHSSGWPYEAHTGYNSNNGYQGINEVVVGEVVETTENGFWIQGKTFFAVNSNGTVNYVAQSQYTTVRFVAFHGWEFLTTSSFPEFSNEYYNRILNSNSFQPNEIGVNLLGSVPELIQTAFDLTNTINSALASSDLHSRQTIEALSAKVSDFMKNANEELRKVGNTGTQVPVHSA